MNAARYLVLGALLIITAMSDAITASPSWQHGRTSLTVRTVNATPQDQPPRATSLPAPTAVQDFTQNKAGDQGGHAASALQRPTANPQAVDSDLPKASSPLPLISVIGFGILVGGIVSAMKTRS